MIDNWRVSHSLCTRNGYKLRKIPSTRFSDSNFFFTCFLSTFVARLFRTYWFLTLSIHDTPTELLKHIIPRTFLSFSQHVSYPMPNLLLTTPLVQYYYSFIYLDTSLHLFPILYCSAHFSAFPWLTTPHLFCIPLSFHILHLLLLAADAIHSNSKQFTSTNCSSFTLTYIRPPFTFREQLVTLLLTTFTLYFLLLHSLPNSLAIQHNFSSESPLVLHHLQITAGLSQTCDHSHSAIPALSLVT